MTRLGIKPQSTGYQVDALNRYIKRRRSGNDIAIGAEGLEFNSLTDQIGHSVATARHRCDVSSVLPRRKPEKMGPNKLATRFGVLRRL